jgi:hypothetical protein
LFPVPTGATFDRVHQRHIGSAFQHDGYLEELTRLRNQLEGALSSTTQAHDTDGLVQQIKALRAANTIEASPERTAQRKTATLEESSRRGSCGAGR